MEIDDLLIDEQNELKIKDGDLEVGESTLQHQNLLLLSNKGEWKQYPDRCVGVVNYIENADNGMLSREIHSEFTKDGMKITSIKVNVPSIEVEAEYAG